MKVWIKLVKYFRGGSKEHYMLVEPTEIDTEEKRQDIMSNWGDNSDGGHAYGYSVRLFRLDDEEVKIPPKEWLEKAVRNLIDDISYKESAIRRQEAVLREFSVILANYPD